MHVRYERPDPRAEQLDRNIQRLAPEAFPLILRRVAEIEEFKGWCKTRFRRAGPRLKRWRHKTAVISARASVRIGRSGFAELEQDANELDEAFATASYAGILEQVFVSFREMTLGEELLFRFQDALQPGSGLGEVKGFRASAIVPVPGARADREWLALRAAEPWMIAGEIESLLQWTASRLSSSRFHPLVVIAVFGMEFLAIRPFARDNESMSRLLITLLLMQCGYHWLPYASWEQVIYERRAEHYLALRKSQSVRNLAHPNLTPWLLAFLESLWLHAEGFRFLLDAPQERHLLSQNQAHVLDLFKGREHITNRLIMEHLGLPRETAKQILNRLLALRLLERRGAGRATHYQRMNEGPTPGKGGVRRPVITAAFKRAPAGL